MNAATDLARLNPNALRNIRVNFINAALSSYNAILRHAVQELTDVWVNVYVANEPFLFSQLWCLGVASVTTNDIHGLHGLTAPVWYLEKGMYIILTASVSFITLLTLTVFFIKFD